MILALIASISSIFFAFSFRNFFFPYLSPRKKVPHSPATPPTIKHVEAPAKSLKPRLLSQPPSIVQALTIGYKIDVWINE